MSSGKKRTEKRASNVAASKENNAAQSAASAPEQVVIGIDFGTTHCSVGIWQNGRAEVIANEQGNRSTPSVLSYSETELLVGEAAESKMHKNSANTVFDIKRLMGKKFSDPDIQRLIKRWPFKVIAGPDDTCRIMVQYQGKEKVLSPEEAAGTLLRRIKAQAESYLGKTVTTAVIAVPVSFTTAQRQSMLEAAKIAKLHVKRLINEPTAAVLAYGMDHHGTGQRNVLVFDLGGGTLGVTLIYVDEGMLTVEATHGDNHLGGEDFDDRLTDHFMKEFNRKTRMDISDNKRSLIRLRTASERAKKILSQQTQAAVDIDSLYDGVDFSSRISRARFEDLIFDYIRETKAHVEQVLKEAELEVDDVDDVLVVGAASRVPRIQAMLESMFGGASKIQSKVTPEEAVALGATIQAAILAETPDFEVPDLTAVDVVPLSLGLETQGGVMSVLIERYALLPASKKVVCSTQQDEQTSVCVKVYEGERQLVADNTLLGYFVLDGIPPMPRGVPVISIEFVVDESGVLRVSAVESSSEKAVELVVQPQGDRLSKEDVEEIAKEADEMLEEDEEKVEAIQACVGLQNFVDQALRDRRTSEERQQLLEEKQWLQTASGHPASVYSARLARIKQLCKMSEKGHSSTTHEPTTPSTSAPPAAAALVDLDMD